MSDGGDANGAPTSGEPTNGGATGGGATGGGQRIFGMSVKWARRALMASLAMNFLIIGVAGGLVMKAQEKQRLNQRMGSTSFIAHQIVELTDEPRRETVRAIMVDRSRAFRAVRAERREKWSQVSRLLAANPYDAVALERLFDSWITRRSTARRDNYQALASAIAMMNEGERVELSARLDAFIIRKAERDAQRAARREARRDR